MRWLRSELASRKGRVGQRWRQRRSHMQLATRKRMRHASQQAARKTHAPCNRRDLLCALCGTDGSLSPLQPTCRNTGHRVATCCAPMRTAARDGRRLPDRPACATAVRSSPPGTCSMETTELCHTVEARHARICAQLAARAEYAAGFEHARAAPQHSAQRCNNNCSIAARSRCAGRSARLRQG